MCLRVSDKKNMKKNIFFAFFKESDPDPDPLVRGTDPHQIVTDPQHCKEMFQQ
jgi:hypothetical protein